MDITQREENIVPKQLKKIRSEEAMIEGEPPKDAEEKDKMAPTQYRSNFSSNRKTEDRAQGIYKAVEIGVSEPEKETK